MAKIENSIYQSIIGYCEELQASKAYKGNGHHLAQRITRIVSAGILAKKKKKIYEVLTEIPQLTGEIAKKAGMSSKDVSAHLMQLHEKTMLLNFKEKNKRRKMWYRNVVTPENKL